MSRRGGSDPDEFETRELEVPPDGPDEGGDTGATAADDANRLEEIPVVEESSIRNDPLGEEAAAAAWASGATPPPEMIPGDQGEPKTTSPSGTPERREGLEPFAPHSEPEPPEPGTGQETSVPVEESHDPSLGGSVWREDEVRLPGAADPLVTPDHVEAAPTPSGMDEPDEGTGPSSDLLITERGHTIISPKVVEKIAGRAASEVDGVGGVQSSGLGRFADLFSGSDKRETQAHAEVDRASTAVDLVVSVRYPEPVGAVANRVRQHVIERLHELTGLQVGEVNVSIPELVVPSAPPPRPRVI